MEAWGNTVEPRACPWGSITNLRIYCMFESETRRTPRKMTRREAQAEAKRKAKRLRAERKRKQRLAERMARSPQRNR